MRIELYCLYYKVIRYFLTLFHTGVAFIAKFYVMQMSIEMRWCQELEKCPNVDCLQCYYSSLMKLEDQNCLSRPRNVHTVEDDLVQFWRGNMVDLIEVNPRSYYLDDGLKMDLLYKIFMYVMLSEFSDLNCVCPYDFGSYWCRNIRFLFFENDFVLIHML